MLPALHRNLSARYEPERYIYEFRMDRIQHPMLSAKLLTNNREVLLAYTRLVRSLSGLSTESLV